MRKYTNVGDECGIATNADGECPTDDSNSVANVFVEELTPSECDERFVVIPIGFFQGGEVGRSYFLIGRMLRMGMTPRERGVMK